MSAPEAKVVKLTDDEIEVAAICGVKRRVEARRKNLKKPNGDSGKSGWAMDIEGAAAELAFAKYLGVPFEASVNTFKMPDVGTYQVRSSQRTSNGLIVRRHDGKDEIYVLVLGEAPLFFVAGWALGSEVCIDKYYQREWGQWLMPNNELHDITTLPRLVEQVEIPW